MENKASKLKREPYPWLLLRESQGCRNQIFFNVPLRRKTEHVKKVFRCGFHGWLVILEDPGQCYLWNAFTHESVPLPWLDRDQMIHSCISPSPSSTGSLGSLILIFFNHGLSFIFCRVGDQEWTEQRLTDSCHDFYSNIVFCNGKLFAIARINGVEEKLVVMDLNPPDGRVVCLYENIPCYKNGRDFYGKNNYIVESCGDIFIIYLLLGGKLLLEVTGVEVFKLDFSTMEWTEVESFKDRAILLDVTSAYSYRVVNPETEGNRIYMTWSNRTIYEFHVEEKSMSLSWPNPDVKSPWRYPIWAMAPTCSRQIEHNLDDVSTEIVPYPQGDDAEANEACNLCWLPLDMLSSIASSLLLHDYINFRCLNRTCRIVAPPIRIRELARNSLPPLLMFCKRGEDKCKFTDPLQPATYLMNNPNKLNDVRMCYSKQGWCLMVQNNDYPNMFLWNPFTKKILSLPSAPYPTDNIIGCELSYSPDSSPCILHLICYSDNYIFFDNIDITRDTLQYQYYIEWNKLKLSNNNNLVSYKRKLYFLDSKGTLNIFNPSIFLTYVVPRPHNCDSFYQSFLLESDDELISVFYGFMGKWVKVFKLDFPLWLEVDNLGDITIYVSPISSFSIIPTAEELRNSICFSRFYENKLVYYSLSSKKFHCFGSDVVIEDLYNTKEQLYCSWIEPRW